MNFHPWLSVIFTSQVLVEISDHPWQLRPVQPAVRPLDLGVDGHGAVCGLRRPLTEDAETDLFSPTTILGWVTTMQELL